MNKSFDKQFGRFVVCLFIGLLFLASTAAADQDFKSISSDKDEKAAQPLALQISVSQPHFDLYAPIVLEYCLMNQSDSSIDFPVTGMSELIGMKARISKVGGKEGDKDLSLELDRKIRHKSTIKLQPGQQLNGSFLLLFDQLSYDFLIKETGNYSIYLEGILDDQKVKSNSIDIAVEYSQRDDVEQMLMEYVKIITDYYSREYPSKSLKDLDVKERRIVCHWLNKLIDGSIQKVLDEKYQSDQVSHEQVRKQFETLVEKWPSSPYAPFVALCLADYYSNRLAQECGLSTNHEPDALQKCDRFQKACHYYAQAQMDGTWRKVYAIGREAGLRSWALYQGGDSSRFDELYNSLLNNQDHFLSQEPLKRIERSVRQGRYKTLPASLKHLSKESEE